MLTFGEPGFSNLAMLDNESCRVRLVLDRNAVPTIVAARRDDVSAIEIEVVRIELRWVDSASPVVATDARVPQRASSHIHVPATS